jgi:hypothetical protein
VDQGGRIRPSRGHQARLRELLLPGQVRDLGSGWTGHQNLAQSSSLDARYEEGWGGCITCQAVGLASLIEDKSRNFVSHIIILQQLHCIGYVECRSMHGLQAQSSSYAYRIISGSGRWRPAVTSAKHCIGAR